MRRLLIAVALVGATLVPGVGIAGAQDEPAPLECPAGTMADDLGGGVSHPYNRTLCVCVNDASIEVVSQTRDGVVAHYSDPADCPAEAPPAPPTTLPPDVLAEVEARPVVAVVAAPAFTG